MRAVAAPQVAPLGHRQHQVLQIAIAAAGARPPRGRRHQARAAREEQPALSPPALDRREGGAHARGPEPRRQLGEQRAPRLPAVARQHGGQRRLDLEQAVGVDVVEAVAAVDAQHAAERRDVLPGAAWGHGLPPRTRARSPEGIGPALRAQPSPGTVPSGGTAHANGPARRRRPREHWPSSLCFRSFRGVPGHGRRASQRTRILRNPTGLRTALEPARALRARGSRDESTNLPAGRAGRPGPADPDGGRP